MGRIAPAGVMLVLVLAAFGCSNPPPPPDPAEVSMKNFVIVYGQFLRTHKGQPPANEGEFRKHIEALSETDRELRGIKEISNFFVSSRDQQPYVVRYGSKIDPPGPDGAPWVANEQQGQNGKRFIAYATGQIEEADEDRFQKVVTEKK